MKKIWLSIALLSGFYAQINAFNVSDTVLTMQSGFGMACRYISATWQCIPSAEGVKGFCVWSYKQGKNFFSNLVKYPPEKVYQYLAARAKSNPLEAVGAITLLVLAILAFYIAYLILYKIVYWILSSIYYLLKRSKKE